MIFAVFNAGPAVDVLLPDCPPGRMWEMILDTTDPDAGRNCVPLTNLCAPADCVLAFVRTATGKEAK